MKRKRFGFTLVEMLVVVAIIAIMAAILYPVYAGARRKVRQTVCATNLRQLGMAISMYSQDHDGLPPIGGYNYIEPNTSRLVRVYWEDDLLSAAYVKTLTIFQCPNDSLRDYRAAYGVNRYVMGWGISPLYDSAPYPSHTVMVTEKVGTDWIAWPPTDEIINGQKNPYYYPLDPRHENQINILFVDGHIGHAIINELVEGPRSNLIWRF